MKSDKSKRTKTFLLQKSFNFQNLANHFGLIDSSKNVCTQLLKLYAVPRRAVPRRAVPGAATITPSV